MIKNFFFLLLLLLSFSLQAQNTTELERLLDIDRFHAYLDRWSLTMSSRNRPDLAEAVKDFSPEDISKLKLDPKKLADPAQYDDLIHGIITKKFPQMKVTRQEVSWDYNFYKRKLAEAYSVGPTSLKPGKADVIEIDKAGKLLTVDSISPDQLLLNADSYVSGRTTRGVFWEASKSGRPIELHVGSAGDFRSSLAERGAKIIGQIKTVERNYNPIYLIQLPGEKEYRYAVTEISGSDRLKHFALQSDLIRWEKTGKPNLQVFGDAASYLLAEEVALKGVLENIPPADKVIIGQKGAIERTLSSLGKNEAVLNLAQKYPKEVEKVLTPELQRLLMKAKADPSILMPHSRNQLMNSEKLYDALEPLFEKLNMPKAHNPTVFNLDRGSYEVSDYLLKDSKGKVQRWRVFSNSWGDEVLPIARALKATNHNDIIYIGTAGALPENGLKVGDLVLPSKAVDQAGDVYTIRHGNLKAEGAKVVDAVTNVASPFEESTDWLGKVRKSSQVVEIETSYLAQTFNSKGDKLTPYLLISDVVGVEGETLAEASSASRTRAQHAVLSSILEDSGVVAPVPANVNEGNKLAQWFDELAPNRDPLSRFQVLRKAQDQGISTKADLEKLLKLEPSFTTARVETFLEESDKRFEAFMSDAPGKPKFSISRTFLEGRWNPASEPVSVHFQVATKKAEEELIAQLAKMRAKDKNFDKFLDINISRTAPDKNFIRLQRIPEYVPEALMDLYKDSALGFGGLAATETRTGSLKFVQVGPGTTGKAQATLAYFGPDKATEDLLSQLKGSGTEKMLKKEIEMMNAFSGPNDPWKIKLSVVDDLVGNNLAQIVPELAGDAQNLTIHLRITKAGLKNPAVVMEELIHLQQITGAPVPWKAKTHFKAFVHPYHWAEVVANSRAGSLQATEKLARIELEAARAAEDAAKFYLKQGLFDADKNLVSQYLDARAAHAEELYTDVAKMARKDMREKTAAWNRAKEVFDKLESQQTKLNDLVAKGDRKGTRKLVEQYLPWDLMEPSEKKAWTEWLDAMEKPDKTKTKLVFRGMYDDTVMRNAKGEPYLMSTVMTRNQGNYTRRLRSLATMREKFGQEALRDADSLYNLKNAKNPGAVSVMMANHAIEAKGSPFLSTASYDVATKFGPRQLGAFQIDERRLILNALSPDKYLYQHEMLTPLFIFPDEVVHFHDYAKNPVAGVGPRSPEVRKKHYIGELEKKIGRKVTDAEISGKGTDKDFLKRSYKALTEMVLEKDTLPKAGAGCALDAKSCKCLFTTMNKLLQ